MRVFFKRQCSEYISDDNFGLCDNYHTEEGTCRVLDIVCDDAYTTEEINVDIRGNHYSKSSSMF